jgi:hypothetical protein
VRVPQRLRNSKQRSEEEDPLLASRFYSSSDPLKRPETHFVGSASAISELRPLWLLPSFEVLPVAIYA